MHIEGGNCTEDSVNRNDSIEFEKHHIKGYTPLTPKLVAGLSHKKQLKVLNEPSCKMVTDQPNHEFIK